MWENLIREAEAEVSVCQTDLQPNKYTCMQCISEARVNALKELINLILIHNKNFITKYFINITKIFYHKNFTSKLVIEDNIYKKAISNITVNSEMLKGLQYWKHGKKKKMLAITTFAQHCADGPSLNPLNMQEYILTENKTKNNRYDVWK